MNGGCRAEEARNPLWRVEQQAVRTAAPDRYSNSAVVGARSTRRERDTARQWMNERWETGEECWTKGRTRGEAEGRGGRGDRQDSVTRDDRVGVWKRSVQSKRGTETIE